MRLAWRPLGLLYYGYAVFSLLAGAAPDRLGARVLIPLGALAVGCGLLLFGTGQPRRGPSWPVLARHGSLILNC